MRDIQLVLPVTGVVDPEEWGWGDCASRCVQTSTQLKSSTTCITTNRLRWDRVYHATQVKGLATQQSNHPPVNTSVHDSQIVQYAHGLRLEEQGRNHVFPRDGRLLM